VNWGTAIKIALGTLLGVGLVVVYAADWWQRRRRD
jgi:hypothetical protein